MEVLYPPPTPTAGGLEAANNLSDVASAASARVNLEVLSAAETRERLAARAPRARMASDGATTNRALIAQFGAHQNVAGQAVTFVIPFTVPTANPSTTVFLGFMGATATPNPTVQVDLNAFSVVITSAGALLITQTGTENPGRIQVNYAGFRAAFSGQKGVLAVRFPEGDSTTNPVITWNGADITSSFSLTTAGTPTNWMDANLVTTNFLSGFNWPASDDAPVAYLLNYDVGADEALRLSRGEPFRGVDLRGGSMATRVPSGTGFSFGATDGTATGVADTFNAAASNETATRTGGAGTYVTRLTRTGTSGDMKSSEVLAIIGRSRVLIAGWMRKSAGATVSQVRVDLRQPTAGNAASSNLIVNPAEAWTFFSGVVEVNTPLATRWGFAFQNGANGEWIEVDDLYISVLGLLDAPILQPCNATDDATRQGMSRRMLGMSTVTEDQGAGPMPISVRSQAFTAATSVQILGGALTNKKARVVSVRGNSSASTTISLGTSSGGTQIVNAQAVNGDFDISTFASRILASGASLWVTFADNTTADLKITIEDL
jgi:hypothetical protein